MNESKKIVRTISINQSANQVHHFFAAYVSSMAKLDYGSELGLRKAFNYLQPLIS